MMSTAATVAARTPRYQRWPAVLGTSCALAVVLIASGEVLGWPYLAEPLQRWLSATAQRRISFAVDGRTPGSVSIHLAGRLRIDAPLITIDAPPWSSMPPMLVARDAVLSLRYTDLWRARHGHPLRIRLLEAADIQLNLERRHDGRSSWRIGEEGVPTDVSLLASLPFDRLKADVGRMHLDDRRAQVNVTLNFSHGEAGRADAANASPRAAPAPWLVDASGMWGEQPIRLRLEAVDVLPWIDVDASADGAPAHLYGQIGGQPIDTRTPLGDVRGAAIIVTRGAPQSPP